MCSVDVSSSETCLRASVSSTVFPAERMQLMTSSYEAQVRPFTTWIMSGGRG